MKATMNRKSNNQKNRRKNNKNRKSYKKNIHTSQIKDMNKSKFIYQINTTNIFFSPNTL